MSLLSYCSQKQGLKTFLSVNSLHFSTCSSFLLHFATPTAYEVIPTDRA